MDPLSALVNAEPRDFNGHGHALPPELLIYQRPGWRSDLLCLLLRYDMHYQRGQLALCTAGGARVALLLAPFDDPSCLRLGLKALWDLAGWLAEIFGNLQP